jgi:hypothetical protein
MPTHHQQARRPAAWHKWLANLQGGGIAVDQRIEQGLTAGLTMGSTMDATGKLRLAYRHLLFFSVGSAPEIYSIVNVQ